MDVRQLLKSKRWTGKLAMNSAMNKQVVLISKSGPAFDSIKQDADDCTKAHARLTAAGAPEVGPDGRRLGLVERVDWLIWNQRAAAASDHHLGTVTYSVPEIDLSIG
jgi:hypothetical protein